MVLILTSKRTYENVFVIFMNANNRMLNHVNCIINAKTVMIHRVINMINAVVITRFVILTLLCQLVQWRFKYYLRIIWLLYNACLYCYCHFGAYFLPNYAIWVLIIVEDHVVTYNRVIWSLMESCFICNHPTSAHCYQNATFLIHVLLM